MYRRVIAGERTNYKSLPWLRADVHGLGTGELIHGAAIEVLGMQLRQATCTNTSINLRTYQTIHTFWYWFGTLSKREYGLWVNVLIDVFNLHVTFFYCYCTVVTTAHWIYYSWYSSLGAVIWRNFPPICTFDLPHDHAARMHTVTLETLHNKSFFCSTHRRN